MVLTPNQDDRSDAAWWVNGALGSSMLALLGRSRIGSGFLRTRIGSRPIIVLNTLITRVTTLNGRARSLVERTVHRSVRLPVSRRCPDFEFVQLIPLFIGAIPFRDGIEFTNPSTRINWLRIIHGDIMNHSRDILQPSSAFHSTNLRNQQFPLNVQPYNSPLFFEFAPCGSETSSFTDCPKTGPASSASLKRISPH